MFDRKTTEADVGLQFRQACAYHDYCYRHGAATYGYDQAYCDFSLFQAAYRTCQKIYKDNDIKFDPSTHISECHDRAKTVLLGVRIGGSGSFQTGENSSYFEFDSMPEKADAYQVTRWVEYINKTQPLRGYFITFIYRRGATIPYRYEFPRDTISQHDPQLFPKLFITTPPHVVDSGSNEQLISVARRQFRDTEVEIVGYDNNGRYKSIEMQTDADAGVFWFVDKKSRPMFWSNSGALGSISDSKGSLKAGIHDIYRTLQHPPLVGRFLDKNCELTAIFKRGGR